MNPNPTRRKFLKVVSFSLASTSLAALPQKAEATTNPGGRAQYKYQDSPNGDWSCSNCLEFIPGRTVNDLGQCKKIPLDDEIMPDGYCTAWSTL